MESSRKKHVSKRNVNLIFNRKKKKPSVYAEAKDLQLRLQNADLSKIKTFQDIPLSKKTQEGLKNNDYIVPTEIQKETILPSLNGEDILGAAETGSGKTLAFIIPVLEKLYSKQWTLMDGVGALIITPTRELAYQIYETLLKVGKHHDFSAGLIIGGKDLHFEKNRLDQCNIVICTPGRILHHMDINPLFDCTNLQILVLDEADRCLDLGFEQTMNSIIENLPEIRQTLLFSATQTKSVKDLARLSLKFPKYVSVHENKKHSTPDTLEQSYIVCEQHDKINLLWSFLNNHRKQKILIFLSSCKQVKFIYQLFCRLRAGSPLLALYGTLHQLRRMKIYNEFCSKQNVVMFSTDIAARGLDFLSVNWVVQLDCPEDANTYIHRAGRTARYKKNGESLLVLLPSEEKAMLSELEVKKIPIHQIQVNPSKLMSPIKKIEALLARDPNLKSDAQRAFLSYLKSVYLMKNKEIFKVKEIDLEKFAQSLGLVVTPRVRFLQRLENKQKLENMHQTDSKEESSNEEEDYEEKEKVSLRLEEGNSGDDDDMEFFQVKRKNHELDPDIPELTKEEAELLLSKGNKKSVVTKASLAKKFLKKNIKPNKKTLYDEEGEALLQKGRELVSEKAREMELKNEGGGINIEESREILREEDKFDKMLFKEKVKAKHKDRKRKMKGDVEKDVEIGFSSESNGEDEEPDLDWLPDPDKVYGKDKKPEEDDDGTEGEINKDERIKVSESEEHENVSDDISSKTKPVVKIKRKRKLPKSNNKISKKSKLFDTGLSLEEDEELALRILQNIH